MKPIGIEVGGQFLDVTGSIRFKLVNPMFETDSIPGINVFPFDLPGTPNNKRLLSYFNLAEDSQYVNSVDAVVYLYGNIFLRGGLKYKWVKDKFEAEFSQVMGLYDDRDALINTIVLDEYDMDNQDGYALFYDYLKERSDDLYLGTKDFVLFPMYNPSLMNNKELLKGTPTPYTTPFDTLLPDQYVQYINYWDYHEPNTGAPDITDFWFRSIGTPDRVNDLVISPSYYIKHFVTKLMSQYGFGNVISPDFFGVGDIEKLVMTSDKFFRMRVNLTAPLGTDVYTPLFIDFPDFIFRQSNYLPNLTIFNFLLGLKCTFNLSYFFGRLDGKVEIRTNEAILSDENYDEWTNKCFLLHEKEAVRNTFTIKYSDSDDALNIYARPVRTKTILPSVSSFSGLPAVSERGKICLVVDENNYYEQDYGLSGLQWWSFSTERVHYAGSGETELESHSDTWHVGMQEDQIEGLVTDNIQPLGITPYGGKKVWRVPQGEFAGSSDFFSLSEKDTGYLRLLFYRGMRLYNEHYNYWIGGNTTPVYPYATNDEYDPQAGGIGTHSLLWHGDNGLYLKWWSAWMEFLKTTVEVRRAVVITLDDLLGFDFKKKKMIDGIKYFWKDGDVVISNEKGIETAVATFLKVNRG